jgi:hypothetical protein
MLPDHLRVVDIIVMTHDDLATIHSYRSRYAGKYSFLQPSFNHSLDRSTRIQLLLDNPCFPGTRCELQFMLVRPSLAMRQCEIRLVTRGLNMTSTTVVDLLVLCRAGQLSQMAIVTGDQFIGLSFGYMLNKEKGSSTNKIFTSSIFN